MATEKAINKQGFAKINEAFITECDNEFEELLARSVGELCQKSNARVIGLTGPTCSGKTTAAKKLLAYLGDEQKRVITVSLDDFFKDQFSRSSLVGADPSKLDFDSPDTLDTELLGGFIDELFAKGKAKKPIFDFVSGDRSEWVEVEFDDDDILLLEGIQVLYPSVLSVIEAHGGAVLAVIPESSIKIDDVVFDPNFIRLCRRIVRDSNFRGAAPEFTIGLWESVRRNEEANIFPYMDRCDVKIDTTLAYEMNVLTPYLRRVLATVEQNDKYYPQCVEILDRIKYIVGIEDVDISEDSLYREFV